DATRHALEEPDVAHRRGEVDVAHALAAGLGARGRHAAALADDALVTDALVLTAVALPVLGRTKDALAEQAVLLGLERPVVDRLRLGPLPRAPGADLLGGGQADLDRVEIVDVDQIDPFLVSLEILVGAIRRNEARPRPRLPPVRLLPLRRERLRRSLGRRRQKRSPLPRGPRP